MSVKLVIEIKQGGGGYSKIGGQLLCDESSTLMEKQYATHISKIVMKEINSEGKTVLEERQTIIHER